MDRRKLVADEHYCGVEARAFRAGLERSVARFAAHPVDKMPIDVQALAQDFRLSRAAAEDLLRAMLSTGLVERDDAGRDWPTALFSEYATASVVAPLSRDRARLLLQRARELAAEVNADWARNRFCIALIAVSGGYMSRSRHLPKLSLWMVLQPRTTSRARRWKPMLDKRDSLRRIVTAVNALSSFISVHVVADKTTVRRPFAVVFESSDDAGSTPVRPWSRLRDWGATISRSLWT